MSNKLKASKRTGKARSQQRVVRLPRRLPKRFCELVNSLATLHKVRELCRELGVPTSPDTKQDRQEIRAQYAELRAYIPKGHQHKIRKLIKMAADELKWPNAKNQAREPQSPNATVAP